MSKKGNLFERIGNLLSAVFNNLLDKAENPELMLKEAIRQFEAERKGIRDAAYTIKTQIILNERHLITYRSKAEQAKMYIERYDGDPEASEKIQKGLDVAGTNYASYVDSAKQCKVNLDAMIKHYDKLIEVNDALSRAIDHCKVRASNMIARHKMASSLKRVHKALAGIEYGEGMELFERMHEKIEQESAEAEAIADIATDPTISPLTAEILAESDIDGQAAIVKIRNGEADQELAELR